MIRRTGILDVFGVLTRKLLPHEGQFGLYVLPLRRHHGCYPKVDLDDGDYR